MKKFLLTGASGFIGKNILELLGNKYKIFFPSSTELDLLDNHSTASYFKDKNFDAVIHAAAVSASNATATPDAEEKIVEMFQSLLGQRHSYNKIIFLGSGAEYGKQRELKEVSEEEFGQLVPTDAYGLGKYNCSKIIEHEDGIVNLRCFGVYGKYENASQRFISQAIISSLRGEAIVINKNVVFDYLWVGDLVKIIGYFINFEPKNKFYNVASGQQIDLITLADIIAKQIGNTKQTIIKTPGLNNEYTANIERLRQELPQLTFTNIDTGIAELISFYKKTL
jgi:GDP-L-fucose synthase